jgi:hypothetical protein
MSSSANTSRGTQYTVLNASLEKLKKNLEVLEANVEQTMAQSEWAKQLAVIHSSLYAHPAFIYSRIPKKTLLHLLAKRVS